MIGESTAGRSVRLHLQLMLWSGLMPLQHRHSLIHRLYMICIQAMPVLFTLQGCAYIYSVRNYEDKFLDALFLLLSYVDCIYKQAVFYCRRGDINHLLETMAGPRFNQQDAYHKRKLEDEARRSTRLLQFFLSIIQLTCLLLVVFPILDHLQGVDVEFAIWLPFDANVDPFFSLALVYVYAQTALLGLYSGLMVTFASALIAQCTVQIKILRYDLEHLVERSEAAARDSGAPPEEALRRQFVQCLLHYTEILGFASGVEAVFGSSLFFQFALNSWMICTSAYRMPRMKRGSVEFLSSLMYIVCVLIQLLLFCYHGNELTHESTLIVDSAYGMRWVSTSVQHRRALLIFMERSRRPLRLRAGFLFNVDASTYIRIVHSSYSYYAVLDSTNH